MKAIMRMGTQVPKVRELRARAVRVPMELPHQTASGTISESPLVLTDITTYDGTVGHSMIFTYSVAALKPTAGLIINLEPFVKGRLWDRLRSRTSFRNIFASSVCKDSLRWRFLPSTWRCGTL